jgi:hypothetical protein
VQRGLGFVHHARTIFCRAVPNLSITIRNFFIAVRWLALGSAGASAHGRSGSAAAAAARLGMLSRGFSFSASARLMRRRGAKLGLEATCRERPATEGYIG